MEATGGHSDGGTLQRLSDVRGVADCLHLIQGSEREGTGVAHQPEELLDSSP